jgi:hypothetical protein
MDLPGIGSPPSQQEDNFMRGLPNILRRPPIRRRRITTETFIPSNRPVPDLSLDVQREIFKLGPHHGFTVSKDLYRTRDQSRCWDAISRDDFDRWVDSLPIGSKRKVTACLVYRSDSAHIEGFEFLIEENGISAIHFTDTGEDHRVMESASSLLDIITTDVINALGMKCMLFDRATTEEIVSMRQSCGVTTYPLEYYMKLVEAARYFMSYPRVMGAFLLTSLEEYESSISRDDMETLKDYVYMLGRNTDIFGRLYEDLITLLSSPFFLTPSPMFTLPLPVTFLPHLPPPTTQLFTLPPPKK